MSGTFFGINRITASIILGERPSPPSTGVYVPMLASIHPQAVSALFKWRSAASGIHTIHQIGTLGWKHSLPVI